ncbi:MAG: hypothetical protein EHM33_07440 [Chloroflexi bacterium]|nr:MAG: hypothetical protein EHM33_07440 [Chloroflexota bacterium]
MGAATTLTISPFQTMWRTFGWLLCFVGLVVLYFILFALGGGLVAPYLPAAPAEPGPVPQMTALLIVCVATVLVIMLMIYSSRWYGWKLVISMSVAFYLVMTLVTQLEAWYFLLGITIGPELMTRLFLQGIPTAFIFIPVAALVMGRVRASASGTASPEIVSMPLKEWLWKLGIIYIAYLVLYYSAGYFIAWQNPDVRAFYGSPGDALPFFQQMAHVFSTDPWLTPYQLLRTLIWVAGAYPIIRGSRLPLWQTALIVGLVLSVPQNIGHILPNSLIPLNSVRISHLIETASSTFVFGLIVTWLLYPKYLVRNL